MVFALDSVGDASGISSRDVGLKASLGLGAKVTRPVGRCHDSDIGESGTRYAIPDQVCIRYARLESETGRQ
jgi:hypothetical protein